MNFLQYSDRAFRLTYLNSLNYQNRLRHSEYVEMLETCGFEILKEQRNVDAAALEMVKTLRLSPQFSRFSPQDLATMDSYLLARKPVAKWTIRHRTVV